jgi:ABC-type antimicrobial peptide transport system permease subunit
VVPAAIETRIIPLQQLIDPELRPWRLGVKLFSAFGVLALLVTAVGLYSVISYSVTQRTHELGIRLALGARPGELGLLIMRQTLRIMLFGVVLGSIAALAAGRLISSLLYATAASDPAVFGIVAITLLVVAVMAVLLPTRRAMRVDPLIALRIQ